MAFPRTNRKRRQPPIASQPIQHTGWRSPDPQSRYDAVIVGGGGHSLATAYYLAKVHRIRRTAVLERGWLGESSWPLPAVFGRGADVADAVGLYQSAAAKFPDLAAELDYDPAVTRCGVIEVAENGFGLDALRYAAELARLGGAMVQTLARDEVLAKLPLLASPLGVDGRRLDAALFTNGGYARPERMAWAYARAADELGVDVVQNCEVTEVILDGQKATGVMTNRGQIDAPIIVIAAEGYASDVAAAAGFTLPVQTRVIEVIATEPFAPVLDTVVISRSSNVIACQMETGEIVAWGGVGNYGSLSPWGSGLKVGELLPETVRLLPGLGGANIMRRWSAIVDVTPDAQPLIGRAPIDGVYLNCGWGHAGYGALPSSAALVADLLARSTVDDLIAPFSADRFETGSLLRPAMIPASLSVVGATCF
jgi:sarcosine oxidase subunit beta